MKDIIGWLVIAAVLLSISEGARAATELKGKSEVREVSLFKDRAFVTRSRRISLPRSGAYSVVFSNITPIIQLDSLKTTVSDKKNIQIMGIRNRPQFRQEVKNAELKKIQEKIKLLERKSQDLFQKVRSIQQESQSLQQLSKHYRDSIPVNLHTKKWSRTQFRGFLRFLKNRSNKIKGQWKKHYLSYQKIYEEMEFLRSQEQTLRSPGERDSVTVVVDLLASKKSTTRINIEYLVRRVGWTSVYDIRVDSKRGRAILEHHALLRQESGEDWNNVKINLSNSRAELKPKVPAIHSYSLSYRKVEKVKTQILGKHDEAQSLQQSNVGVGMSNLDQALSQSFVIPHRQTVLDGMKQSKVFIGSARMPYQEHLEVAAHEYRKVFRKGKLKNKLGYKLAAGVANIYYDGAFLQQTHLQDTPIGQPVYINAGIEHNISVSYGSHQKKKNPGMLSSNRHYLRRSYTSLTNWNSRPKKVKVLDRIPVSEIKEVKVSANGSTAGYKKLKDFPSWVYWEVDLPSRKQKTVELRLDVSAPEDFQFQW